MTRILSSLCQFLLLSLLSLLLLRAEVSFSAKRTIVSIPCSQIFHGCTAQQFQENSANKIQFEQAVAQILISPISLDAPEVNISLVSNVTSTRRYLKSLSFRHTHSLSLQENAMNVDYNVSYSFDSTQMATTSQQDIYQWFVSHLHSTLVNGTFVQALKNTSVSVFQNISTSWTDVSIGNSTIRYEETSSSTSSSPYPFTISQFIGIIIGGVLVFLLLIAVNFWLCAPSNESTKKYRAVKVQQSPSARVVPTGQA